MMRARALVWLKRYGPAEIAATFCALAGYRLVSLLTSNEIAAAYGGALGENLGFYTVMVVRDLRTAREQAARKSEPFVTGGVLKTLGLLGFEFGLAEFFDSLFLRPLFMGMGARVWGPTTGLVAGKLAADATFYLPAILFYEMRKKYLEP